MIFRRYETEISSSVQIHKNYPKHRIYKKNVIDRHSFVRSAFHEIYCFCIVIVVSYIVTRKFKHL